MSTRVGSPGAGGTGASGRNGVAAPGGNPGFGNPGRANAPIGSHVASNIAADRGTPEGQKATHRAGNINNAGSAEPARADKATRRPQNSGVGGGGFAARPGKKG
jgi:hypothetical protein